jgi:hypothetical protein
MIRFFSRMDGGTCAFRLLAVPQVQSQHNVPPEDLRMSVLPKSLVNMSAVTSGWYNEYGEEVLWNST